MSKYDELGQYLKRQAASEIPMTFAEIEDVLGTTLPPSAYRHRPWWSNNPNNSVMTKAWLDAGYRTERVDMAAQKLVFKRAPKPAHGGMADPARNFKPAEIPMEKKQGHHPLIGSMKGTFTLVPPDKNEAPPEDPESWEALALAKLDRLLFANRE
ncbi:MAG TPA: hypothetical protein VH000_13215 [Rhizomicrobium sp.]|nr:hypothetical protein [Rhizomicrobium sp.]